MTPPDNQNRSKVVGVRFSPNEFVKVEKYAQESNNAPVDFIRRRALIQPVDPLIEGFIKRLAALTGVSETQIIERSVENFYAEWIEKSLAEISDLLDGRQISRLAERVLLDLFQSFKNGDITEKEFLADAGDILDERG